MGLTLFGKVPEEPQTLLRSTLEWQIVTQGNCNTDDISRRFRSNRIWFLINSCYYDCCYLIFDVRENRWNIKKYAQTFVLVKSTLSTPYQYSIILLLIILCKCIFRPSYHFIILLTELWKKKQKNTPVMKYLVKSTALRTWQDWTH